MVIYLISTDGYRDSTDLEQYFTSEEQIKKYIKSYYLNVFGEVVRNIQIDFKDMKITFENIWIDYVKDAAILLGILTGIDTDDEKTKESEGKAFSDYTKFLDPNGLKGKRIGIEKKKYEKKAIVYCILI